MLKKQKKEQEQTSQPNSHSSSSKDSFMDSSSQNTDSGNADGYFLDYSLISSYLRSSEVNRSFESFKLSTVLWDFQTDSPLSFRSIKSKVS